MYVSCINTQQIVYYAVDIPLSVSKSVIQPLFCMQYLVYSSSLKTWALRSGVCICTYPDGTTFVSEHWATAVSQAGPGGIPDGGGYKQNEKSVRKSDTILPAVPAHLTSILNLFQMIPDHSGDKQSAPRLCKSIPMYCWKYLQLWRCIQDAMRFDLQNSPILELLRPLRRSPGDFESNWDLCPALRWLVA